VSSVVARNPNSVNHALLLQIISQFDLIMIQELRDSSQMEFPKLMAALNHASVDQYGYRASSRLGSSRYKEQYVYVYK